MLVRLNSPEVIFTVLRAVYPGTQYARVPVVQLHRISTAGSVPVSTKFSKYGRNVATLLHVHEYLAVNLVRCGRPTTFYYCMY